MGIQSDCHDYLSTIAIPPKARHSIPLDRVVPDRLTGVTFHAHEILVRPRKNWNRRDQMINGCFTTKTVAATGSTGECKSKAQPMWNVD
jgi:hypothetical protein